MLLTSLVNLKKALQEFSDFYFIVDNKEYQVKSGKTDYKGEIDRTVELVKIKGDEYELLSKAN